VSHAPRILLAVDVGNSRVKCGLFDNSAADVTMMPRCLYMAAVAVGKRLQWDEIADRVILTGETLVPGIIAGVNPGEVRRVLESWPTDGWNRPIVVEHPARFPLTINLPASEKVGIDRLLNAVAANAMRPCGRAAIIVDIGTATTVDYLSPQGTFEGGAILPGFELSARSLHQQTALLPMIEIEDLAAESIEPLGRNTPDALKSGLLWGQLGAIKELIERISSSVTNPQFAIQNPQFKIPLVLLTGGGSSLLKPHLPDARWEPHLALQGLALVMPHFTS